MNEELIKRIEFALRFSGSEIVSDVLEDCRAALSKKYVPMTDDEAELLDEVSADSERAIYTEQGVINPQPFARLRTIENVVIRRAGLEVEK